MEGSHQQAVQLPWSREKVEEESKKSVCGVCVLVPGKSGVLEQRKRVVCFPWCLSIQISKLLCPRRSEETDR